MADALRPLCALHLRHPLPGVSTRNHSEVGHNAERQWTALGGQHGDASCVESLPLEQSVQSVTSARRLQLFLRDAVRQGEVPGIVGIVDKAKNADSLHERHLKRCNRVAQASS